MKQSEVLLDIIKKLNAWNAILELYPEDSNEFDIAMFQAEQLEELREQEVYAIYKASNPNHNPHQFGE